MILKINGNSVIKLENGHRSKCTEYLLTNKYKYFFGNATKFLYLETHTNSVCTNFHHCTSLVISNLKITNLWEFPLAYFCFVPKLGLQKKKNEFISVNGNGHYIIYV